MEKMKGKLGVYHLMIVSQYFNTIDDYINLEISTPKARGNMGKFHMNHIPLDQWSRQFFTSVETLHIYNKKDEHFAEEEFYRRIFHYPIYFKEWDKCKKESDQFTRVIMDYKAAYALKKIPRGITDLEDCCLCRQRTITDVIIPDTVTYINDRCIMELHNLTKLVLSKNLKYIGNACFYNLPSLKEIELPDSLTLIGTGFLASCNNLTAMTIPSTWKQFGKKIYSNNSHLFSFYIPEAVRFINGKEIERTRDVDHFEIPTTVTSIDVNCFRSCRYTSITIPSSVVEIPYGCFDHCCRLKERTIPNSLTLISWDALVEQSQLTSLIIGDKWEIHGDRYQQTVTPFLSIKIPSGIERINGEIVDENVKRNSEEYEIPAYATMISEASMSQSKYTKIIIPTTIKEIPDGCFYECDRLKEIELPTSITRIGYSGFEGCSKLMRLVIPTSVVEIGDECFKDCVSIKSLEIPTSVTMIGERICYGCQLLKTIILHDNYREVKDRDYWGCYSLVRIEIPSGVSSIGEYAFSCCGALKEINLQNVQVYGKGCFSSTGMKREDYPQVPEYCFKSPGY